MKRTNERYVTRLIEHNGGECKRYITASVKYVIVGDKPHRGKLRKVNYTIITVYFLHAKIVIILIDLLLAKDWKAFLTIASERN